MMQKQYDYYEILQVPPHSSIEHVRDSYRHLAKEFHPDRNPGDTTCEEKLVSINIAFQFLSDPIQKKAYDETLATVPREPPPPLKPQSTWHAHSQAPTDYFYEPLADEAQFEDSSTYEPKKSQFKMVATICSLVLVTFGVLIYSAIRQDTENHSGSALQDLHELGLLPSLHTGLLARLSGHAPDNAEQIYESQIDDVSHSAQSDLADASQTLSQLHEQDSDDAGGDGSQTNDSSTAQAANLHSPLGPVAMQRKAVEAKLNSQIDDVNTRVTAASSEIKDFRWNTPGWRLRLRSSTIDSDLQNVDDAVDSLHDTTSDAQALLLQRDPPS